MATTVWTAHLTFGLVSMPERLVRAARVERVKLRQLHRPRMPSPEKLPRCLYASKRNVGLIDSMRKKELPLNPSST
jgi:hypothetical protein